MRDVSLPGQIFSLLTVAIMISSAWIVYMQNEEDLELNRVPVWARNQMPYDTTQAYSFVLQQGEYEILETENEFNSEHVYVEYELPLSELGAAATCAAPGGECPKISLAYWRPKVPTGVKVPVIAEFGPYFGETSAGTPDVTTPGSWLGVGIIQNLLPHGFAFV